MECGGVAPDKVVAVDDTDIVWKLVFAATLMLVAAETSSSATLQSSDGL